MEMWGLLKTRFYRVRHPISAATAQRAHHHSNAPANTQIRPKNRICPSRILSISPKTRRQAPGATNGNSPSNTSTSASAGQNTSVQDVSTQAIRRLTVISRRCLA